MTEPLQPQIVPGPIPPRPPIWPTVIGIIFVVLGALGMLGAILEAIGPLMMERLGEMMPDEVPDFMEPMAAYRGMLFVRSAALFVVAGLLLTAGIGLLRRRSWAMPLAILWAVLKLGVVVFDAWLDAQVSRGVMEAMSESGEMASGMQVMNATPFLWVGIVMTIVWGWALPLFTFVWFAVPKIRADVRGWRETTGRSGVVG